MKSLRDKLRGISSQTKPLPTSAPPPREEMTCYQVETRYPLYELGGVEHTLLDQVKRADPSFDAPDWSPHKLLFIDTETTGLSRGVGTIAFLVGVGWIEGDEMVVKQFMMRDYDEELPMLEEVAAIISRFDIYVSFNGKSFDLPLLLSRFTMQRMRTAYRDLPHVDLLHMSRRVWKLRLKSCSLGALEESILGFKRQNDLPGSLVPERYFAYLKTHEFALLRDVLLHNAQDIRSLAILLAKLCNAFNAPQQLTFAEDIFSIGRTLERGGYGSEARRCYYLVDNSKLGPEAREKRAMGFKKERDWVKAQEEFINMIAKGEGGIVPFVELAKYFEHKERDYQKALRYTRDAMDAQLNRLLLIRVEGGEDIALKVRERRLLLKIRKQANHQEE